ncbi:MAG TPA: hypothetical protein VFA16_10320 [Mycobacterium sp.]|uniref:hypothetical protein n=1 Tax=Mycobacterium sp. TaxID=1785 RepID=UPI002D674567|nr:hypothetical protein [Mycobacterium sp.]HZU47625.1 hypothetical protein [Mycobacterium sp.]
MFPGTVHRRHRRRCSPGELHRLIPPPRRRFLTLLGGILLLAEALFSATTTALPAAAASAAPTPYRYIFGDVWDGSTTISVAGQVTSSGCTYVGTPTTVQPGFVHEVREVGFAPATCTYTVEQRTVPVSVAQPDLAATSSNPAAPPICYENEVCTQQWADGNPNGTDECLPLWLAGSSCSGTATWYDFCALTTVGDCYITGTGEEKQSEISVWTGADYGVSNGCVNNPSYPSQFVWIGHTYGDQLSGYNFGHGGSCGSITASESGLAISGLSWPPTCVGATVWIDNSFTGDNNLNVTGSYGASMSGSPLCVATTYFVHYDYAYGTVVG